MRAKQEQQRAEKAAKAGGKPPAKATPKAKVVELPKKPASNNPTSQGKKGRGNAEDPNQVQLFAHLPQYHPTNSEKVLSFLNTHQIPADVVELGFKYANRIISGSNARARAMLTTFLDVIARYFAADVQEDLSRSFHRELEAHIRPFIDFLSLCRPKSVSMGNSITFLKQKIGETRDKGKKEAEIFLNTSIQGFIAERIDVSKFIAFWANPKIVQGDVILVYASSCSVERTLVKAHKSEKQFKVMIVDSLPGLEGRGLLHRLVEAGLECSYVMLNAISFIMAEVTKVILGAFAMLTNGNLISRAGNAVVAMMAHRFNIPVMVCCESYKFVDRAQLDSICFNELGNPDALVPGGADPNLLQDWRSMDHLKLLNLQYDLTPAEFLSVIITEFGLIPPTSIPLVLREHIVKKDK